jgi:hypothetical protein
MRPEPKASVHFDSKPSLEPLLELVRMACIKLPRNINTLRPKHQRAEAQQVSDYSGPQSCSFAQTPSACAGMHYYKSDLRQKNGTKSCRCAFALAQTASMPKSSAQRSRG